MNLSSYLPSRNGDCELPHFFRIDEIIFPVDKQVPAWFTKQLQTVDKKKWMENCIVGCCSRRRIWFKFWVDSLSKPWNVSNNRQYDISERDTSEMRAGENLIIRRLIWPTDSPLTTHPMLMNTKCVYDPCFMSTNQVKSLPLSYSNKKYKLIMQCFSVE